MRRYLGHWQFEKEGVVREVDLPHDAMLTEHRSADLPSGVNSGYFPGGFYTYRTTFTLTTAESQKQLSLFCEGVYRNATVYINGAVAGAHAYGYTEFSIDIAPYVRAGTNEVQITVDNTLMPNCRWYSGAGLYRAVWLCIEEHPEPTIVTKSCHPAVVEITGTDAVEIYDGETCIARGGAGDYTIPHARLWSAETPYLYTCRANGHEIRFGIRTIQWNAQAGLLINGRRTLLRGGCIHHDNGVLGARCYPDAEYRRVEILKKQGFNALRIAHNPASRALLDACDALGVYVMDECFDGWYTPKDYHDYARQFMGHYREDLRAMAEKDKNHPCVILYSIGNEVTETAQKKGIELAAQMRDYLHSLDGTRPVTCGVNVLLDVYAKLGFGVYKDKGEYKPEPRSGKGYREKKTGSAFFNAMAAKLGGLMFWMSKTRLAEKITAEFAPSVDIMGLNYASSRYDPDAKKYPDRMMVGTETMVKDLPHNWPRVKKYPQLIGDFVWAAWDYLGEACIGDWTYHSYPGLPLLAGQGMIDITGKPLASMAFMQTVWGLRKKPFIAVSPLNHAGEIPSKGAWQFTNGIDSWTWHGYEGKKATVEVYTDGAAVRLELNGKSLGLQKVKNFRAVFRAAYLPGRLTAVALDSGGREMSRFSLATGGREIRLTARLETYRELTFVTVAFTDEHGVLLPYVEQPVSAKAEGLCLLGFGSALAKTAERYDGDTFTSYRGRVFAVVKGKGKIIFRSGALSKEVTVQ